MGADTASVGDRALSAGAAALPTLITPEGTRPCEIAAPGPRGFGFAFFTVSAAFSAAFRFSPGFSDDDALLSAALDLFSVREAAGSSVRPKRGRQVSLHPSIQSHCHKTALQRQTDSHGSTS